MENLFLERGGTGRNNDFWKGLRHWDVMVLIETWGGTRMRESGRKIAERIQVVKEMGGEAKREELKGG